MESIQEFKVHITKEEEDLCFEKAWAEAKLSACLKKKVGAVLYSVQGEFVAGIGHGGAKDPCTECVRKKYEWMQDGCWSIHSEMRAIFDALETGEDIESCVMFVTHGPCDQCLKLMHLFNIQLVVYDEDYHNDYSKWEGKIRVHKRGEHHDIIVS